MRPIFLEKFYKVNHMTRIIFVLNFLLFYMPSDITAQVSDSIKITFGIRLENQSVQTEKVYEWKDTEIEIEILKFYIGQIQFLNDEKAVGEMSDYFLIDFEEPVSLSRYFELPENSDFNKIQFHLGVDSLTHEAGAIGGDLDPINGMYWAWNTGYINFKLEGKSPICESRGSSFQYHLGGYLPPHQTAQTVTLDVPKKSELILKLDLAAFLNQVDLKTEHTFMSPGAKAAELSKTVSTAFSIED